jgi:hypothetical protein
MTKEEIYWTLELLVYADDINLLGENINTVKKDTEAILIAN